jgi:hypothetical protein
MKEESQPFLSFADWTDFHKIWYVIWFLEKVVYKINEILYLNILGNLSRKFVKFDTWTFLKNLSRKFVKFDTLIFLKKDVEKINEIWHLNIFENPLEKINEIWYLNIF